MVHFVEAAGADFQLHFLYALHQVVFYCSHFLSWCPLHCPITIGRLQCSCSVRPSAMECIVCSHQLPHAPDFWWRQFGWNMLHNEELYNHSHHSHAQAFLLSTSDQLFWRHHHSLHQGSFERVLDRFLGMKNDCMQTKTKMKRRKVVILRN